MGFKTETYIIKGMKQDLSDAVFDKSFAFENMNIRILARQNNSTFSVEQEMGNTKIDEINLYDDLNYTQFNSTLNELPFNVIGTCVIDNYIVLFGVDNTVSDGSVIARIELVNGSWKMVYLYQGSLLGFSKDHPVETLPNVETNSVKKVYFVDGVHSPRAINVMRMYPSNDIGDITLGTHLELNEEFTVSKVWDHSGQYPGGKVQFAFSYLNQIGSETNLIEVSPMFDCTMTNNGISNNSAASSTGDYTYAEHSFEVRITNLDSQYEFIRVYLIMTTSAGTTVIKYIERHLDAHDLFTEVIDYDEADLIDYTGIFADLNARETNIIPYTMATKDNFMFYGNIKEAFPDISDIVFDENDFRGAFSLKKIGKEEYLENTVYTYTPRLVSYEGSNFEYMGFRKSNWYRFGIIVQHESGKWSDVLFLCDKQCNKSSETRITYDNYNIPQYSTYYIPRFELYFTQSGLQKLRQLVSRGFKKVKPVCVVPPPKYRNVISQGIVAPTMYKGENRLHLTSDYDFCFPSYFYRPKPLSSPYTTLNDIIKDVTVSYSYTLRNVGDLALRSNFMDGDTGYLTNPTFARETDTIRMNSTYREYRHGFSLPPKNTINAEGENCALNMNEYCFIDSTTGNVSDIFSNDDFYVAHNPMNDLAGFNSSNPSVRYSDHPNTLWANNYKETIFIDESVCTFNSPEIDLNDLFTNGVRNFLLDSDVRISGYAQITGSYSWLRAAGCYPQADYSTYANKTMPSTRHLFNISDNIEVDKLVALFGKSENNAQQALPYTTGPFYFHPIKVLGVLGNGGKYDGNPIHLYDSNYITTPQPVFRQANLQPSQDHDERVFFKTYRKDLALKLDWSFYGELKDRKNKSFDVEMPQLKFDGHSVIVSDYYACSQLTAVHPYENEMSTRRMWLSQFGITSFPFYQSNATQLRNSNYTLTIPSGCILIDPTNFTLSETFPNVVLTSDIEEKWLYFWDDYYDINNNHTRNQIEHYNYGYYYFYPFIGDLNFYMNTTFVPVHPMLLPNYDSTVWFTQYFTPQSGMQPYMMAIGQWATLCMRLPRHYGGHYYMPFSTSFPHTVFDPLYACSIYPFFHENANTSLIGTTLGYTSENPGMYIRPEYNNTATLLYSNNTNYFADRYAFDDNGTTQGYYSIDENVGVRFDDVDWLRSGGRNLTLKYEFNLSGSPRVMFTYKSTPLVAAMKWYRGFVTLDAAEDPSHQLVAMGSPLTFESYIGNTAFSGMLPQRITKSGFVPQRFFGRNGWENIDDITKHQTVIRGLFDESTTLSYEYKHRTYPHIVFTGKSNINLLPEFTYQGTYEAKPSQLELDYGATGTLYFNSELYYKLFVHWSDFDDNNGMVNGHNIFTNFSKGVYRSIYPHSGTWMDVTLHCFKNRVDRSRLSYWQYFYNNNNASALEYSTPPQRKQITIDPSDSTHLLVYDGNGESRKLDNFWMLQIADLYNKRLEEMYTDQQIPVDNRNPYKYEGISSAYWNWMPCGYSKSIETILNSMNRSDIVYDEGDTYFQRYNSIKSYKQPATSNTKNDISDVASIMIESYINLDGHYWDHTSLRSYDDNVFRFPEADTQSKINPVYTLNDGYMSIYHQRDENYPYERHYPTRIMWTARKINGEYVDSWGLVPASNYYDTLGTCGDITKLVSYNDNVFCLQQHGFSVLDFNSKSLIQSTTGNPISVYFQEGLRLQNNTYLSRDVGTLNKWSVVVGRGGIYWMDETLKSFYKFPGDNANVPVDLSLSTGFKAWSNNNIFENDAEWTVNKFNPGSHNNSYKANYDIKHNDVYWGNTNHCICYNELVGGFTSFFSYERVPYMFNYRDEVYSLFQDITKTKFYNQFSNYKHQLYGASMSSYVELLVNPDPLYDKVFNFIEYDAECFDINSPNRESLLQRIPNMNPYNKLTVHNSYQDGILLMDRRNTSERFRTWRTDLPREQGTMNRIRSPWCRIRLENELTEGIRTREYRDQLHYISVNYTVPEQPMKTNLNR